MRAIRIGFVLIGLCGLMLGQTTSSNSGTSYVVGGSGLVIGTGNAMLISDGSGLMCATPGGSELESRSAKVPGPTLKEVKSSAHKIPASDIPTASYMKTAKAINLKSSAIEEAELAQIIVDHGFSIYDYAKVDNYLYHAAIKQGTNVRWVWKAMRDQDAKASEGSRYQTFNGMGRISGAVYAKAIPERILEKAECLLTELPDAILLVSDYEVVRPDPFLAVTTPRMLQEHRIFIVDQWDEPGFTESPIVKPYEDVSTEIVTTSTDRTPMLLGKFPPAKKATPSRKQSLSGN
jgi:hypothetical protein